MVLTKAELISSLQKEVRILAHLAGKVDAKVAGYRPTANQRSTLDLLRYMSIMGPGLVQAAKAGAFDGAAWGAALKESEARDLQQTIAVIAGQGDVYARLLGDMSDADLQAEMNNFDGSKISKGAFIVNLVLSGHAAYRTQLFLYLKANGHDALSTYNLWQGVDAPATV
jgi:hypothetical protein